MRLSTAAGARIGLQAVTLASWTGGEIPLRISDMARDVVEVGLPCRFCRIGVSRSLHRAQYRYVLRSWSLGNASANSEMQLATLLVKMEVDGTAGSVHMAG